MRQILGVGDVAGDPVADGHDHVLVSLHETAECLAVAFLGGLHERCVIVLFHRCLHT